MMVTAIRYPLHPENNVRYHYGNVNNVTANRTGRVVVREDGSGASEYDYDLYGNVTRERRTFVVPNNSIETYVTSWEYGPFGRVLSVSYPDGERVTYGYDRGGELKNVTGLKGQHEYVYAERLYHDRFGQRTRMALGDGTTTLYEYDDARRLSKLSTHGRYESAIGYSYDKAGNVSGIECRQATNIAGNFSHIYEYDCLDRLMSAKGSFAHDVHSSAEYTVEMEYDNLHRIVSKHQEMDQTNVMFSGFGKADYTLDYTYSADRPFRLGEMRDLDYSSADPVSGNRDNRHSFRYDADGNMTYVSTAREIVAQKRVAVSRERKLLGDEEDRLRAISDNGFVL